jgi:hypothetical protein
VPARNAVLDRTRQRVAEMQRAGHVGRRNDHHEALRVGGGRVGCPGRRASGCGMDRVADNTSRRDRKQHNSGEILS